MIIQAQIECRIVDYVYSHSKYYYYLLVAIYSHSPSEQVYNRSRITIVVYPSL